MCDTLGFLAGGRAYFAKNSDRSPNEPQVLEYHPARPARADVPLKATYMEIPDADAHAVLISRPTWMWGAETGINDCGVCIGNEAVFTKGAYGKTGLTGMDMLRLALERSGSAENAVDVITVLLGTYGQGGNCGFDHDFYYDNSFLIIDRTEMYVLETANRHWTAKRCERASISNRLSIGSDGQMRDSGSPDSIDFKKKHLEPVYSFFSGSKERSAETQECLENASGVSDMMRALRTHAADVVDPLCKNSVKSVCMHAGGAIGDHTTASMIVELGDFPKIWATGSSTPCISLFKPFAFGNEPTAPVFMPCDPAAEAYWLKRESFHRSLIGKVLPPEYYKERDGLEQRWLIESAALDRAGMHMLSKQAAAEEADFYERWSREALPDGRSGGGFKKYWAKKNAALGINR